MLPFLIALRNTRTPVVDTTALPAADLAALGLRLSTDADADRALRSVTAAQLAAELTPAGITRSIMQLSGRLNRGGLDDDARRTLQGQLDAWLQIYQRNFNCHRFEP